MGDGSVSGLEERDSNEGRLLSLVHEFRHLRKKEDGICTVYSEKEQHNQPEEKYCDEFAACLLMPEQQLKSVIKGLQITTLKELGEISKLFGVSKLVTIIRMKELNIINPTQYRLLKTKLEAVQSSGFGRRNWEQTYVKRTSRLVLNHLIDSFKRGDLTYTSLANITGIKDKYLQKFI